MTMQASKHNTGRSTCGVSPDDSHLIEHGTKSLAILGVRIANASTREAIALIELLLQAPADCTHPIYIVNAHTLNLAVESPAYRALLNSGHTVFADGTGARWAARARGVRMKANLVGTDLIPNLFEATAYRGYRYFLLGATAATIARAARASVQRYPGWELVGFHHGYVQEENSAREAIALINRARPDMLLVGMGNPLQESWIHRHRHELRVPVSVGVGGLFDHWAGNLKRAPRWVRRAGCEWVQLMLQQPHKWRRYLAGNPKFLLRMTLSALTERSGHLDGR